MLASYILLLPEIINLIDYTSLKFHALFHTSSAKLKTACMNQATGYKDPSKSAFCASFNSCVIYVYMHVHMMQ